MSTEGEDVTTQSFVVDLPVRSASTAAPPVRASGRLVCVAGHEVGRSYRVGPRAVVIGRATDADIVVEGSDISRHHARIEWRGDLFAVVDLGSTNGTSVNGLPMREAALHAGDRIAVGAGTLFVFTYDDELENRALQLQKLESLAQLAGGIVHDFRNMLAVIVTNGDLLDRALRDDVGEPSDWLQMLADVRTAARSGLDLTRRLLSFSRRNEVTRWITIDVASLIAETVGFVSRSFAADRVEIDLSLDPALRVRGDVDELRQCVLNLLANARDAMPDGGRVRLVTVARSFTHVEALRHHLPYAGAFVETRIDDTGVGMSEAVCARIFEPFFTTKAPGVGTGLGLSTVYGVVRNHGGNVLVESTPGAGTSFRLLLPHWNLSP